MNAFLDDLDAMVISSVYVFGILALAEIARRRGVPRSVTRKIVHVGIGTWVIPTFLLFDHRLWAVIPPACFVVVNALSFRFHLIRSVEGETANVGTILYPISVACALGFFWPEPWPVVGAASILVMAWGDAAASLVGRRHGRRIYRAWGHPRSLEGSAAMLGVGFVGILASFVALGEPVDGGVLVAALIAATVATGFEAVSLWGFDNLLVPGSVAVTLVLSHGSVWA
mgnify:CR=1 FL=1